MKIQSQARFPKAHSWSSDKSLQMAEALHEWLPNSTPKSLRKLSKQTIRLDDRLQQQVRDNDLELAGG